MVREHGDGDVSVPPTIHALLQARIDSLDGDVRVVMERGAVEGEVFHRGSVAELSPDPVRSEVGSHLATLIRKELIRATPPAFPEDEGFRFRHLLIRDAAYESLPKATRAQLHERFAEWLEQHELVERDEIVGYHLEQAHRYRSELDASDPARERLARRASSHLAAAGEGALDRGDLNAGRSLLSRATGLLPDTDEARLVLAPDFAGALFEAGDAEQAWRVLSEASRSESPRTRARATVTMATWAISGQHEKSAAEREASRNESRAVFESTRDEYGLAMYWWGVSWESWFRLRAADTVHACERALEHLDRSGVESRRLAGPIRARLRASYYHSPMPVAEAIERTVVLGAGEHGLLEEADERHLLGRLYAMTGEIERARELVRGARQVYLDSGLVQSSGGLTLGEAEVEFRAGDFEAEERVLREGLEVLLPIGDRSYYPTVAAVLAECLYRRGADDAEIEELCDRARETTGADDLTNFLWLDMVAGLLHARRGEHEAAEERSRQAVAVADSGDFHLARANSRAFRAEVLARAGRRGDAARTAAEALEILEKKGDVAGAAQFKAHLAAAGVDVP